MRFYIWYAVRSFYAFHRLPLPNIPRNEVSRLFTPSRKDKRKVLELAPLKLDEVRRLILNAPQPYRAALMVKKGNLETRRRFWS
jgi:hypothetical protein